MSKLIAVVGAPASGKTTISQVVASKLSLLGNNVKLIQEYPRNYIEEHGHPTTIAEQLLFFHKWKKCITNAKNINYDYIVCDSPVFICYIYGTLLAHMSFNKDIEVLNELQRLCLYDAMEYDKVFYVKAKRQWRIDDNLRKADEQTAKYIDDVINSMLTLYKIPHQVVKNENFDQTVDTIVKTTLAKR